MKRGSLWRASLSTDNDGSSALVRFGLALQLPCFIHFIVGWRYFTLSNLLT